MTRSTNARIAGITFLGYIAAGLTSMAVWGKVAGGGDIPTTLANIAQHGTGVGITILLDLVCALAAITLGVTLYGITRDEDRELAIMGMVCRLVEGMMCGIGVSKTLSLQWLAAGGSNTLDSASVFALGSYLSQNGATLTATFFAFGSLFFSYLFLRGRLIPRWMAWLGMVASVLLAIVLPLQLAGFLTGPILTVAWGLMLAFEVPLGLWLIFKGVADPIRLSSNA